MGAPIYWVLGQRGSGKTTTAKKLLGRETILLDGDEIRDATCNLDMTPAGRWKQNLTLAKLARLFSDQGFEVVVAAICPYEALRREVHEITNCEFILCEHNDYVGDPDHPFEPMVDIEPMWIVAWKKDEEWPT